MALWVKEAYESMFHILNAIHIMNIDGSYMVIWK